MEITLVRRGKLIGGCMIKTRLEQAVQYLDKNSTDLWSKCVPLHYSHIYTYVTFAFDL